MVDRILRAVRLDWTVFREIAEDRDAMREAVIIVVVVAILSAIGGAGVMLVGQEGMGRAVLGFFTGLVTSILIGWIGWAILTYFVGTLLFKGRTDIPEMMRVLGYANAPNLLQVFSFIPCVGWLIALAGSILALIAGVLAIREAMEFDTGKAIITVLISWGISLVISVLIGSIVGISVGLGSAIFGV
jgi:hypothetical protein